MLIVVALQHAAVVVEVCELLHSCCSWWESCHAHAVLGTTMSGGGRYTHPHFTCRLKHVYEHIEARLSADSVIKYSWLSALACRVLIEFCIFRHD